jgi:hypothetical protein
LNLSFELPQTLPRGFGRRCCLGRASAPRLKVLFDLGEAGTRLGTRLLELRDVALCRGDLP